MDNPNPDASNPVFQSVTFWIVAIGSLLVVFIFLMLYRAGSLARIKQMSLNFCKTIGLTTTFHQEPGAPPPTPTTEPAPVAKEVKKNGKRNGASDKRKSANVEHLKKEVTAVVKKRPRPWPAKVEEAELAKAFTLLDQNKTAESARDAKKIFDNVLQRNSESVDAKFGIARVLELRKDLAAASKHYWEAVRSGGDHPRAVEAKKRLEVIAIQERLHARFTAALTAGSGSTSFWFETVPDAVTLAKHFVALSNGDSGGKIIVGVDSATRKGTGVNLDALKMILDAVCHEYVTAPCLYEVYECEHPRCVFFDVQRGLNRPYRAMVDSAASIYVIDGNGGIRLANQQEHDELRKEKRG